MRCSARRSRAAATISMARVIFCTFFTEPMRARMSLSVAISSAGDWGPGTGDSSGRPLLLLRLLLGSLVVIAVLPRLGALLPLLLVLDPVGLALLDRVALLIEVGAEVVHRLDDGVFHLALDLVAPLALANLLHQVLLLRVQALDRHVE